MTVGVRRMIRRLAAALLAIGLTTMTGHAFAQASSAGYFNGSRPGHVICDSGCSSTGGAASNASSGVATSSTNGTNLAWLYLFNGTTWDQAQDDGSKNLLVNCAVGCAGGTASNASDAVATSSNNGRTLGFLYAFNGTTWDRLRDDGSKNLNVNCAVGCSGGTQSNASSGVATSSTNGATVAWGYAFNGTTWDQLQDDGSKNLKTVVSAALPAGSAIVGKVGIDQTTPGTTNAVSATNLPSTVDTNAGNASASTLRVVIATSQPAVPVSAASLPLPTNAAQETGGNLATLAGGVSASKYQENVAQVGGASTPTGAGLASAGGVQRVAAAQDATTLAGSAPGTAGTPSANVVSVQGVSGGTVLPANVSQVGGASYALGQTTMSASAPVVIASNQSDLPIAPATDNKVSGTASQTSTTSTSLIGAVTSKRIYVLTYACSNSGASASLVAFQDGSGGTTLWSALVPVGGGNNLGSTLPMFWTTAGNALFFAPGTASTTVTCNASGFSGS